MRAYLKEKNILISSQRELNFPMSHMIFFCHKMLESNYFHKNIIFFLSLKTLIKYGAFSIFQSHFVPSTSRKPNDCLIFVAHCLQSFSLYLLRDILPTEMDKLF